MSKNDLGGDVANTISGFLNPYNIGMTNYYTDDASKVVILHKLCNFCITLSY